MIENREFVNKLFKYKLIILAAIGVTFVQLIDKLPINNLIQIILSLTITFIGALIISKTSEKANNLTIEVWIILYLIYGLIILIIF